MAPTMANRSNAEMRPDEMPPVAQGDRELLRLHRRACADFAARMRLPSWEHLGMALAAPLSAYTVSDLLAQVVDGNLAAAAEMSGQPTPPRVRAGAPAAAAGLRLGMRAQDCPDPTQPVVESVRSVLAVAAGLDAGAGFSPRLRNLLRARVTELTILGYDLQQAIGAGPGLDELLADRILAAGPTATVWPGLDPHAVELSTPPLRRLLALAGRPVGRWVDVSDPNCSIGRC